MNSCMFSGRLTRVPEVRFVSNGTPVANFSLAINERYKDKDTGEFKENVVFPNFELWGNGAKVLGDLGTGALLVVTGKYVTRDWTDKEDNKRTSHSFRVDKFEVANYGPNGKKAAKGGDDAEENPVGEDKPAAKKRGPKGKVKVDDVPFDTKPEEEEDFGF